MNSIHHIFILLSLVTAPIFVRAETLKTVVDTRIIPLLDAAVGFLVSLAVVAFVLGLVRYLYSAGDNKKSEARQMMVWGVVAMFVMISVWGIVRIIHVTFFG